MVPLPNEAREPRSTFSMLPSSDAPSSKSLRNVRKRNDIKYTDEDDFFCRRQSNLALSREREREREREKNTRDR